MMAIKAKQEAEEAKKKAMKEEEKKAARQKEEDERKENERKERLDFQKMMGDTMNERFDQMRRDLLSGKDKDKKSEIEKIRKKMKSLRQMQFTTGVTAGSGGVSPGVAAKRVREIEEASRKTQEENDKRFESMEEKIRMLTKERDEALVAAENWKNEAFRPGSKRGGIVIEATPSTQTRVRPRCASPRTVKKTHAAEMAACHARKVATLKELRAEALQEKKDKECEVAKLKEKLARLEMERKQKGPGTDLREKMDEAARTSGCRSGKGKEKNDHAEQSTKANDRENFIIENRRILKPLKKDAIFAICLQEGIIYSTLDRTKEDIINKRVQLAFGDEHADNKIVIEDVSEESRGEDGD
ncbi:hypothetical protein CBR_g38035 [Chara braunii]|uniref:Uncharacterized protein n=1 Tax=Chara braunii TaxID=69332 RepID=A0A388K0D3_CHABU|nr:hypothetical protein CBR_g38035 [Chara braunii]|eukprot:GBG63413.1 hypothetical protein CBR_g38035 [Chara braunii]